MGRTSRTSRSAAAYVIEPIESRTLLTMVTGTGFIYGASPTVLHRVVIFNKNLDDHEGGDLTKSVMGYY